jgi:hypothetical protein
VAQRVIKWPIILHFNFLQFYGYGLKQILVQFGLKFKDETSEMLHLDYSFVWCWYCVTAENRTEIPWKFWNVVLKKDAEDQLSRSCERWKSITKSQGGKKHPTYSKKKEG